MKQEIILDPKTSGENPAPLNFFWGLEDQDGNVMVQYDLENGQENKIPNADFAAWNSFVWVPFREPDWVEKINALQDEFDSPSYVESSQMPLLQVIPKKGELSRVTRRGFIEYFDYYECSACGTTFKWVEEDDDKIAVCPNCGMHNIWVCDIHGETNPIHMANGENRCPECAKTGIPRGCSKVKNLILKEGLQKRIHYIGIVDGKFEVEIGDDRIIIRSL